MMTMKSGLSGLFLIVVLSSTVSGLGSVLSLSFSHIPSHYTWQDAQSHCRSHYTDLATIYTKSDADHMYLKQYYAWVGLHRETGNPKWIWTNGLNDYLAAWANNEPQNSDSCAFVSYNSKMFYGSNCGESLFFICQKHIMPNFQYTFIPQSKNWSEAQQYCKKNYDYLAALTANFDMNSAVHEEDFPVWTGLHRDEEIWKWSTGLSEYRNWASNEPGNNGDCVSISSLKKEMATQSCSARFPFVCFRDNLVLVKENKTWEEALEHCRALVSQFNIRYELVSVQPGKDHKHLMTRITEAVTEKVWTGLRFLAGHWLWVNGADMLYSDLPVCPTEGQHCGALSKNETGSVESTDCLEKMNFLCYSTW
ncbi:macrophage mannose receptor 1-like isoform X2 [Siniperca chuatsi]|nr:macrophage mannose receptor 1-like isoform X2 [Siniperca chuatsi]